MGKLLMGLIGNAIPRQGNSGLLPTSQRRMEMDFEQTGFQLHQREIAIVLGQYHLRYLRRLVALFDGDLELPLILGEVANRNVGFALSETGVACAEVDQQIIRARGNGTLSPCSAMSVSLATGLSRETVRRKLNKLADQGFLVKLPDSSFVTTSKPLEYFSDISTKEQLADLLDTCSKISLFLDA